MKKFCINSVMLMLLTAMMISCGNKQKKDAESQPQVDSFYESDKSLGEFSPSRPSVAQTVSGAAEAEKSSLEAASRKAPTNDNDENLHGYKYKYDKNTEYEDGLFIGQPDYISIPAKIRDKPEQILYRKAYALSYNKDTRLANWVAWHLTKAHTYGDLERPQRAFHDDDDVRNTTHYWDYNKDTRYDRGHMCPAGDNKWDKTAMEESFLMTNVCPQYYTLNSGVWNDIEIKCRDWARQEGDVYIVCGPVFFPNKTNREYIGGKNKIPVPDAFFKVVLSNKKKGKGIGFICENRGGGYDLNDYSVTIDEVEELTGIDFFPALPDAMEEHLESQIGNFR